MDSTYWGGIKEGLAQIAAEKPDTFDGVKAILDLMPCDARDRDGVAGDTFFGGGGGDLALDDALYDGAGWRYVWREADYWWAMRSPTGEELTYVEGDVYRGDTQQPGGK